MRSVNKRIWSRAVILGEPVLFLGVYLASASRTIVLDDTDAAEFQLIGIMGGTLHQPYPLWSILARVFAAVPLGEPAFRVTVLSIALGCVTLSILAYVVVRTTGSSLGAAVAVAAFGFSYTFWRFASLAEVYALQTLLFVCVLGLLARRARDGPTRDAFALAFCFGLLLTHHSATVALVPAMLLLVAFDMRRNPAQRRIWIRSTGILLIPFTLYLYTYFVDRGPYPLNWLNNFGQDVARMHGIDITHESGFPTRLAVYMGAGRLGTEWPSPVEALRSLLRLAKQVAATQYPFVGAMLVPVGLISLWRRNRRAAVFLMVVAAAHAAMYSAIAMTTIGDALAYTIPAFAVCAIFIGEGIRVLANRWGVLRAAGIGILVIAAPLLRYAQSLPLSSTIRSGAEAAGTDAWRSQFANLREHNDLGARYGALVSEVAEPGSIVFARWSETHVLLYHQLVCDRLQGVHVRYLPPDPGRVLELIKALEPTGVYLTIPPQRYGLDGFVPVSTHELTPNRRLYRVAQQHAYQRTYGSDSRRRVSVSPASSRSSRARTSGGG